MADSQKLSIFLDHGGRFVMLDNAMEYFGGDVHIRHGIDFDRFGYLDLVDEIEKLGYTEVGKLYYKIRGEMGSVTYINIHNDATLMDMIANDLPKLFQNWKSCKNAPVENPQKKQKSAESHGTAAENPPPAPQSGKKKPRRNPVRMTQTEPALQSENDHGSQIYRERNLWQRSEREGSKRKRSKRKGSYHWHSREYNKLVLCILNGI
ncbi:eukaryotic translation initiation factor 2(eIF-2) family protein, partial [Striga asiatica]